MSRRLQSFGIDESAYERPDQAWICGWAKDGRPCPLGPDPRGRCHTTHECAPRRQGDRYYCSRQGPFGGSCKQGPLPDGSCGRPVQHCQPRRSWRARRGMLSRWTLVITLGGLLFALSGPTALRPESPGPLIASHAAVAGECSACHAEVGDGLFAWARAAAVGPVGLDSDACLRCHMLGDHVWLAHSVPPAELEQRAEAAAPSTSSPPTLLRVGAVFSSMPRGSSHGDLACSTCHPEHRGRQASIATLTDNQCQSCHARQFRSFSHGHPEFRDYPYERRTRIAFDHGSHEGKHFPKEEADFQCGRCHRLDEARKLMQVAGFDSACGDCHRGDIEGEGRASAKGVAFLRVPGLDVETLHARGLPVGPWPAFAEGDPTPFMELLLPDRQWKDLALDLEDLSGASESDLASASDFARDVRDLFGALAERGHAELRARLERAAGRDLSTTELVALAGQLPRATVATALSDWLTLGEEEPHEGASAEALEAVAHRSADESEDLLQDDDLAGGDLLGDDLLGDDDDLLGDDLLGDDDDLLLDDFELEDEVEEDTPPSSQPLDGESWAAAGGWYRSDLDYTLRYRPGGHADAFLRAWLDFAGPLGTATDSAGGSQIFAALSDRKSPGACAKCHRVESGADQTLSLNWHAYRPDASERRFTNFSHGPHLSTGDPRGCEMCHALDPNAPFGEARAGVDPEGFASNFRPMTLETCISCHDRQTAADSCLTCHAYHVGRFEALSHFEAKMSARPR